MWPLAVVLAIGFFAIGYWYGRQNGYSDGATDFSNLFFEYFVLKPDGLVTRSDSIHQDQFDTATVDNFLRDAPNGRTWLFGGIALVALALCVAWALI